MGKAKRERGREKRDRRAMTMQQLAEQHHRTRRAWLGIGVPIGVAVVAAIVLIAISQGSGTKHVSTSSALAVIQGIPQSGRTLGDPKAPVTIHEFADLQCPICQHFTETVLPSVIKDEVRTGKAKVEWDPYTILGDDSITAAEAMLAAADQNKAWPFIESFYANQREENSGYVTTSFIHGIDHKAGVNVSQADAALNGSALTGYDKTIRDEKSTAIGYGFSGTPSLRVTGPKGSKDISNPSDLGSIESAVSAVS